MRLYLIFDAPYSLLVRGEAEDKEHQESGQK